MHFHISYELFHSSSPCSWTGSPPYNTDKLCSPDSQLAVPPDTPHTVVYTGFPPFQLAIRKEATAGCLRGPVGAQQSNQALPLCVWRAVGLLPAMRTLPGPQNVSVLWICTIMAPALQVSYLFP